MTTYTQEQKIDMIFKFIFNDKKAIEEERFWNELSESEVKELDTINRDTVISFDSLQKKHL